MAIQVLTNAKILMAGLDMSGDLNEVALEYGAETKDKTTFGSSTRTYKGGLTTVRVSAKGFVKLDAAGVHHTLWDRVGVDGEVVTLFPTDPTEGDDVTTAGWAFKVVTGTYTQNLPVGELYSFDLVAEGHFV